MKSSLHRFPVKCVVGPILFWVLTTFSGFVSAQSQAVLPKELFSVSASAQIDLPAADVAVLFDASLSMHNHRYDEVRRAVTDFASALTGKEILHLRVFGDVAGAPKSQLVQYADTNHKCCEGVIEVSGSPRLIHLGWECGFGEANSKGFGMVWAVK